IEDIGFDGIPVTSDEAMMDEKPSEQSFDSLGGSLLPDTYDTPLTMSKEEPVLDAMSDMSFMNIDIDDVSNLSLDNGSESSVSEYKGFPSQFETPIDEVLQKKIEEDDPFMSEFDGLTLDVDDSLTFKESKNEWKNRK
ncbi:MAG: hypothetical protein Q9M11_06420, partial [Mariprofundaceae bacterium]|nr:hypothetical protein [Mariprofundaceae bacterium]